MIFLRGRTAKAEVDSGAARRNCEARDSQGLPGRHGASAIRRRVVQECSSGEGRRSGPPLEGAAALVPRHEEPGRVLHQDSRLCPNPRKETGVREAEGRSQSPHQAKGEGRNPTGIRQARWRDGVRFRSGEKFIRGGNGRGDGLRI